MTDPVPLDTLSQAQWEPFAKSRGESTRSAPGCCSGTRTSFWSLVHMVGNFKEICPDFIILMFSIQDISKGLFLRKQEQ